MRISPQNTGQGIRHKTHWTRNSPPITLDRKSATNLYPTPITKYDQYLLLVVFDDYCTITVTECWFVG